MTLQGVFERTKKVSWFLWLKHTFSVFEGIGGESRASSWNPHHRACSRKNTVDHNVNNYHVSNVGLDLKSLVGQIGTNSVELSIWYVFML